MNRPVRGHHADPLPDRLDEALARLRAVEAVCVEEAALGEFYASIDDGVRAGAHLRAAAHLRTALESTPPAHGAALVSAAAKA